MSENVGENLNPSWLQDKSDTQKPQHNRNHNSSRVNNQSSPSKNMPMRTNNCNTIKQINFPIDKTSKLTQPKNLSPKKQSIARTNNGLNSFKTSPQKSIRRYRPIAENKIQIDIVNAIVARDAEASSIAKTIVQSPSKLISSKRNNSPSKIRKNDIQSSPRKQPVKNITRKSNNEETKDLNEIKLSYEPPKTYRKSQMLNTSKDNNPFNVVTVQRNLASTNKSLKDRQNSKQNILNDKMDQITNESEILKNLQNMKDNADDQMINGSSIFNFPDTKEEEKTKRKIKPPGPLIKRSPFKNNPKFNKGQQGKNNEAMKAKEKEKDFKLEAKKLL